MVPLSLIYETAANKVVELAHPEMVNGEDIKNRYPTSQSMTFINALFPRLPDTAPIPFKLLGTNTYQPELSGANGINSSYFFRPDNVEVSNIIDEAYATYMLGQGWYGEIKADTFGAQILARAFNKVNKFIKHWYRCVTNEISRDRRLCSVFEFVKSEQGLPIGWGFICFYQANDQLRVASIVGASEQYWSLRLHRDAQKVTNPINKYHNNFAHSMRALADNPPLREAMMPYLGDLMTRYQQARQLLGSNTVAPRLAAGNTVTQE